MHTIKSRIIILMTVSAVFFALLYIYQEAKGDMVLAVKDGEMATLFKHSVEQLDRQTTFMKQSALRLAAGGAALHAARSGMSPDTAHAVVKRFIMESMRSLPEALGGGLWFEPYAFFPDRRWYGPYAYHEDGELVYTQEYDTPEYDYHQRDWYTVALPIGWDRGQVRDGRVWWSAPYEDRVGKERYLITTSAVIQDAEGRYIGVTSTDWGVRGMADFITSLGTAKGVETWLIHQPSGRVLLSTGRGEHSLPILSDWRKTGLASLVGEPEAGKTIIRNGLKISGKTWHSWSGLSRDGFLLVQLVPDEDRLAEIRSVNTGGRILFLTLCAIVSLIVWLGTRTFKREMDRMLAGLERITLETPESWSTQVWQYQEIRQIAHALTRMAERIHHLSDERLALERGLLQMQKMDALGRMSSGVAHDFNNILQVMYSIIELLKLSRQGEPSDMELIAQLESASRRAGALVAELLSWGRQQPGKREPGQIDEVIDGIQPLLERIGGEHVEIRRERGRLLPRVLFDRVQLGQIVMNLFINARDAMPAGGRVTFRTESAVDGEGIPRIELWIQDEGEGIPPGILDRIFEPFFTTKEEGKGTGLGLAMVRDLVDQNSGTVRVVSEPGRGTIFILSFPPV